MRMIYDEKLAQAAYLFGCQRTGEAIVIDPERDVDRYIDLARENGLRLVAVAETHIHADFLSGARELAEIVGAKVYVSGEGGEDWRSEWLDRHGGGGGYDHQILHDGDAFSVGNIDFGVMHTPGHTPEHIAFLVTDRGGGATEPMGIVTGDFVFVGDLGRPDLLESAAGEAGAMKPAARRLHKSVARLESLPDFVQVWPGHGAGSACGKTLGAVPTSTIGYERRFNPAIRAASGEEGFVKHILEGQPEPPLYFAAMQRLNKVGPKVLGVVPAPAKISAADLRSIDAGADAIIDTRPWAEFREGHVPGSMSFPLERSFSTNVGSLVAENEPLYLIVDPDRLDETVRDLIRIGLDDIRGWFSAREFQRDDPPGRNLARFSEIGVDEARAMIDRGEVRVLDVRRATEHREGHIPGSINIAHTRLASRLDEVPDDTPLLVHCRSGARSARAGSFLQRRGYRVHNLKGGMLAWEKAEAAVQR